MNTPLSLKRFVYKLSCLLKPMIGLVCITLSGRRTFITELASKGVSVRVLVELAGQSSIQTTQRYIDVNPQQVSAAVELL